MSEQDLSHPAKPGKLSVVIPVGRVDKWLDEAVASALAEDELDIEVIAVFNNGAKVPEGWPFLSDPRLRVLYTPTSLGPAGAGQRGIEAAEGELIVCLDADDVMFPGRLRKQYEWMTTHPETVLVSSGVAWIDQESRQIGGFRLPSGGDVRRDLVRLNVAPHSAWMARASSMNTAGGYDLTMKQMEDYDLLLRIGLLGPIAALPDVLTGYRLHPGQLSRAVRPNGTYIRKIARARLELGQKIGMSGIQILWSRYWWELQQWIMFVGRRLRG